MKTRTLIGNPTSFALAAVAGIVSAATSASAAPMPFYTGSTAVSGFGPMATPNANSWGGSDKTRSSVIFEAFIDYTPDVAAVTDPITVFENGADAIGSGVAIHGDDIIFAAGGSSVANTAVATGAHGLSAGQTGVQIVAALEFNAGAGGSNELLSLYVNGSLVATADNPTGNDWAGVNTSNLGASDSFLIFEYVPSINPNAGNGANGKYTGDYPDQTTTITFAAYELGVGDNTVENILVSPPGPDSFPLTITPAASGFDLDWTSQAGMRYRVLSNTGLGTPVDTWTLVEADIAATPPTNTYNVNPGAPTLFYAVEEYPAPPVEIFAENFDGTTPGSLPVDWTSGTNPADNSSLTNWELGTPANIGPIPPDVPLPSGSHCVATNISGNYDDPASDLGVAHTDIWLRSPEINLGAATAGTLSFQQWTRIEDVPGDLDHGSIRILDASDDSELAVMEDQSIDGSTSGWEEYSMALPAAAFTATAGTIKVEFRFEADDIDSLAGWYIDDLTVTVPGS